jgi:hypothetical protein
MNYVLRRNGNVYKGPLVLAEDQTDDQIFMEFEDQPILDFDRARDDLKTFDSYRRKVGTLKPGDVRGVLYIDYRKLQVKLRPIPGERTEQLQGLLTNLTSLKIEQVMHALLYYAGHFKQEPKNLEQFVDYCQLWQRTMDVIPRIQTEIKFVDDMYKLFDEFKLPHGRNPLHNTFLSFKNDQNLATQIRETNLETFRKALQDLVRDAERRIGHFSEKAAAIPPSMKNADVETRIPAAKTLCEKVGKLEPKINKIVRCQKIMGVEVNTFSSFAGLRVAAEFSVRLYEAIEKWEQISVEISRRPFLSIAMSEFSSKFTAL